MNQPDHYGHLPRSTFVAPALAPKRWPFQLWHQKSGTVSLLPTLYFNSCLSVFVCILALVLSLVLITVCVFVGFKLLLRCDFITYVLIC